MLPDLVKNFAGPVPRYTSYPTAPHFTDAVDHTVYRSWLSTLGPDEPVSLYVHIPFCDSLCWYCGCTTKMVKRYDPVAKYVDALLAEIRTVANDIGEPTEVSHIHFGGGSPSILKPRDILRLSDALHAHFRMRPDLEFAVEIDPRFIDEQRITAFLEAGVNRVSFGVQDFDVTVQNAINRHQTYEQTRWAVDAFRRAGIQSVNIDLVYGLPHQTEVSVGNMIDRVLELMPDRISLFGYAHLPSRLTHQRLIDSAILPGPTERFAQSDRAATRIADAGFVRIGLDHFARPDDDLALGRVKRNFQGYTSDTADNLIGFGASAIGRLTQGYVQNVVPTADYMRRVHAGELATARGVALSDEDRARGFVINALMCDLQLSINELSQRYTAKADKLIAEANALADTDSEGLFVRTSDGFAVTERGRPFVRSICSCFDTYLDRGGATYSVGV